ncbi:hypothetical protein Vafri_16399 [Volvox africanus]|uniref:Uncharacterized protein n=1 Tax=Volvox africanus TaxID=51714 RepID=A0A8J4F6N6_9CHLO|nr:hypothetical protein Vafri_16399 [Volvox africanus]
MGPRGLIPAAESALSSGYQSPVYRESSASYPPFSNMHQQFNPNTLQMQLQELQMQLHLQSSNGQASQLQQPRISGLGTATSMVMMPTSTAGLTGGSVQAHVLLVLNEPSLGAIFRQTLSQAPVPCVLYLASTLDLWTVVEQLKKTTGRISGPDIVFFQPEVLMANPGTVLRLKQLCGAGCAAVVLQGSEPIARALQADDFLAGPTPAHPLRKEDLALMIIKWRNRQQQVSGSNSNIPSELSAGGASANSAIGAAAAKAFSSMPTTGLSARSSSGGATTAVPSGALSPKSLQISQLQALQAQLQALQQAKQEQKARGGVVTLAAHRSSNEIEPVEPSAVAAAAVRAALPHRPPPLRLASAGVPPTDAYPDVERNLARSSTPVLNGNTSIRGVGVGVADVSELVAQVAELRRKLGDKSRTASMRSPTGSTTGGMALSPTSSLSGNFASGRTVSGALAGALNSGGSEMGSTGGGAAMRPLSQQLAPPFTELQLQLQSLHTKEKTLQKTMAAGGSGNGGGPGNSNGTGSMTQQVMSGSSTVGAAIMAGLGASQGLLASSSNHSRQVPLQSFGSLERPSVEPAVMTATSVVAGPSPPLLATPLPTSQFASLQLQQQLLQLQQLQLQLQQQQRLGMAAPPAITLEALQPGSRLLNTSPTGSLTSNLGSPLPSPGNTAGTLQGHVSNTGSDSGSVSRSNSFVAAGGTRYRPPRQRSPSPLGSAGGIASGHISDTYPGPGASRFASPQFRSGSGSGAGGAAASGASRRGAGTGSGHTSDSGTSPDLGSSARESVRGGSTALARKSGDDAIAAALNAASGEADGSPGPDSSVGSPASAAVPSSAAEVPNTLADALRGLEGVGDGGSSTDGRSLMDASFVLEDSAGGGRGSISGGAASSIDLQPSPSTPATPSSPPLLDAQQRQPQPQPQTQPQPRSNLGGTRLGSHRLSSSKIQVEPSEDDDQPLRASAARQPFQMAGAAAPVLAAASTTSGIGSRANVSGSEATPSATLAAGVATAEPTALRSGKPSDAAEKSAKPLGQPAASPTPLKVELVSAADLGSGAAPSKLQDSPVPSTGPRAAFQEEDSVRVESPDGSASQLHIQPSPPMPQQHALPSSNGRSGGSANNGGGNKMVAHQPAATQAARLVRLDSQCDERLPSIDGTQPITAAAAQGGCGSSTDDRIAAALSSSSRGRRQDSGRSAGSDTHRGEAVYAGGNSIGAVGDSPSTDTSVKVPSATGATTESQFQSPAQGSNLLDSVTTCQPNDGGSLVASIEGSITAGLPRTGSRGVTGPGQSGSGISTPQLVSSASRGRSGPANGYTDDIFPLLQLHERREVFSPSTLIGGDQQLQLQPPTRPGTPMARRAARILLCSHPIVITREDFLPF